MSSDTTSKIIGEKASTITLECRICYGMYY